MKVPLFFYGMNKTFLWVDLSLFNQILLWWYYNDRKAYRILAVLPLIKQNWYTKPFPQENDYEILNPKWNENSHHNNEGADAVKPKSEVPRSGTMTQFTNTFVLLTLVTPDLNHHSGDIDLPIREMVCVQLVCNFGIVVSIFQSISCLIVFVHQPRFACCFSSLFFSLK